MSDDFQAELRFLGIVSLPAFVRQPKGNGCIERFFRTLKEQLLLVQLDTRRWTSETRPLASRTDRSAERDPVESSPFLVETLRGS